MRSMIHADLVRSIVALIFMALITKSAVYRRSKQQDLRFPRSTAKVNNCSNLTRALQVVQESARSCNATHTDTVANIQFFNHHPPI